MNVMLVPGEITVITADKADAVQSQVNTLLGDETSFWQLMGPVAHGPDGYYATVAKLVARTPQSRIATPG